VDSCRYSHQESYRSRIRASAARPHNAGRNFFGFANPPRVNRAHHVIAARLRQPVVRPALRRPGTLDLTLPDGSGIPIEERGAREVARVGVQVATPGTEVRNPAFDVTPNRYVTAINTETGLARVPYEQSLRDLAQSARQESR
jgi:hypothetical protein